MGVSFKFLQFLLFCTFSVHLFATDKIVVSGLFKDKAIVSINGKQRVLSVGVPSAEGIMLISANSEEAVIEVNNQKIHYKLGGHIGSAFKEPSGGNTVSIAPNHMGMYHVNGSINKFQAEFLVDTGATLIAMNSVHAKHFNLDYKRIGEQSVASTASGIVEIYIIDLATVLVGDIKLYNVKAAVHEGRFPEIILLGNSFLNRVKMERKGQLLKLQSIQ